MRKIGLGYGLIATVLVPLALLLFGALGPLLTVAAALLLSGIWVLAFGLTMGRSGERLYYSGSGIVLALLSTSAFIPPAYTAGLVVLALVALALVQAALRSGAKGQAGPKP